MKVELFGLTLDVNASKRGGEVDFGQVFTEGEFDLFPFLNDEGLEQIMKEVEKTFLKWEEESKLERAMDAADDRNN
jgi:hypothetical protein